MGLYCGSCPHPSPPPTTPSSPNNVQHTNKQNLATRIRNSHAFNLPTIYLPRDDGLPCTIRERDRERGRESTLRAHAALFWVGKLCFCLGGREEQEGGGGQRGAARQRLFFPDQRTHTTTRASTPNTSTCHPPTANAIEDVCSTIDKTIAQTVQKNLRQLRADCERVLSRLGELEAADARHRGSNAARTWQGLGLGGGAALAAALAAALVAVRVAGAACGGGGGGGNACGPGLARALAARAPLVEPVFGPLLAAALAAALLLAAAVKLVWRHRPTLSRRDQRRVEEFRAAAKGLARAGEALYEAWFRSLSDRDDR